MTNPLNLNETPSELIVSDAYFLQSVITDPNVQDVLSHKYGHEATLGTAEVVVANCRIAADEAVGARILSIADSQHEMETQHTDSVDQTGSFSMAFEVLAGKIRDEGWTTLEVPAPVEARPLNEIESRIALSAVRVA